jgi:outer membrane autotransporter protein
MALLGSLQFSDALLSCAARTGTYRFVSEEQCGWLRFGGIAFQSEATDENRGFDQTTWQIAGGGQLALGDDWWIGGALGVDFQHLEVEGDLADSDGVLVQVGVVAKKSFGNTMLAASFSAGYGSYDITRHLFSGDDHSSTEKLWLVAGQLSAAHSFTLGENFYIRPRADFGITHVSMNGLSEDGGGGGGGLVVESSSETYFDVQPSIEFGGEFDAGGVLLRPSFSIGVTQFLGDASPSVTAGFDTAPGSIQPFTIESELDKTYLELRAGVDVFAADNIAVSVEGFGQLSRHTSSYGGGLKLAISF